MLYFKNRQFCFERNNATIDEIKTLAKLLPVIGNHIYDPNDPEAQLADSDFAFFKNTSNDSTNKILQFITKRISHEELKAIIDAHAPDLTISDDYISSKSFTITYKGKEIPCRWSGGPGGKANTNIQTDLKEYAVQVAIELGPRNDDDRDAIETIARVLEDRLKGSKYIPSQKLMDSYIKSAILTANELYRRAGLDGDKFDFELQCTGTRSKLLYAKARKLGASNKDNWNPADLWGFAKDLSASAIENEIKDYETIIQLNGYINRMMGGLGNTDAAYMKIIPISLKKIDGSGNIKISRMDPGDSQSESINKVLQTKDSLVISDIKFSNTFKQVYIFLNNDAVIDVRNRTGGTGSTSWQLRDIGSHFSNGNINKVIINNYVFEGAESKTQKQYYIYGKSVYRGTAVIESFKQFIDDMYKLPYSGLLSKNTSKATLLSKIDEIYEKLYGVDANPSDLASNIELYNVIVTEVIACYYAIKNIPDVMVSDNRTLLQKMYLAGLKIDDDQCSYIKVHQ